MKQYESHDINLLLVFIPLCKKYLNDFSFGKIFLIHCLPFSNFGDPYGTDCDSGDNEWIGEGLYSYMFNSDKEYVGPLRPYWKWYTLYRKASAETIVIQLCFCTVKW